MPAVRGLSRALEPVCAQMDATLYASCAAMTDADVAICNLQLCAQLAGLRLLAPESRQAGWPVHLARHARSASSHWIKLICRTGRNDVAIESFSRPVPAVGGLVVSAHGRGDDRQARPSWHLATTTNHPLTVRARTFTAALHQCTFERTARVHHARGCRRYCSQQRPLCLCRQSQHRSTQCGHLERRR